MGIELFAGKKFDTDKRIEYTENAMKSVDNETKFDPDKRIDHAESMIKLHDSETKFDPDKRIDHTESIMNMGDNETKEQNAPEKRKCINEDLAGKCHPDTGVPFEKRQIEVEGKMCEVVVPKFESKFDAQLPESQLKETDPKQFKECNAQLKEAVANNKELRESFDDVQLEQIEDGETPDGCTWHHDAEPGKMQLVDTETHQRTGHTGGRSIWGGGTENR